MKWVKKIAKALALLVVIVVLGLYLYGFRPGGGQNSATVEIHRPAAQVWRYLSDDDLVMKWVSGLKEIRHKNPGVAGTGARFEMTVEMDGQRTDMVMEITAFDAPKHIGFRLNSAEGVSPAFTETGEYVLTEANGTTQLTLSGSSKYFPFWVQLMEPMITPAAQKKLEGDLARLKSLVEAEPRMMP
jgi:uncharacterized protein YndB with AHSA1/START domain